MSVEDFIIGASDVCYRYYQLESDLEYYPSAVRKKLHRRKLYEYLGESELRNEYSDQMCTLLDLLLTKLSEEKIPDFQSLHDDLIRLSTFKGYFGELLCSKRTSLIVYDFLRHVCFSEDRVEATRILYKVLDDCEKISSNYTNVSSGGQAEGLNIPCGDYDLMTIIEQISVHPMGSCRDTDKPYLIYNTDNSYPGFAHLMIPKSKFSDELSILWGVRSEFGPLISNKLFKEYFACKYRSNDIVFHGPCLSNEPGYIDHLFCFRGSTWPSIAQKWIQRSRLHDWPPMEVISNAVNHGILFVPIGSKFGSEEDCCIEWRMSFSLPERELIHSFNHTQLLCFTFFKYIKRDLAKNTSKKLLCTYIIKTTLFWVCEEYPPLMWTPDNIIKCFHIIRQRLIYWMKNGFCPHYFIPENNLFEGLMSEESKIQMELLLMNFIPLVLQSSHYGSVFKTFSFRALRDYTLSSNSYIDQNKAVFILLRLIKTSFTMCTSAQIRGILSKSLFRLLHNKFSFLPKGLYLISFCYANQIHPQLDQITDNKTDHKTKYVHCRNTVGHLLIGTKVDVMTGWLLLAFYFCSMNRYDYALKITDLALMKCLNDKMLVADGLYEDKMVKYLDDVASISWNRKLSFRKQMNTSCIDLLHLVPGSSFCLDELLAEVSLKFTTIPPLVFVYFLRFVCFKRTGNIVERDNAIRDIIVTCREDRYLGDNKGRVVTYALLANIYKSMGDNKAADYWILHAHRRHYEMRRRSTQKNSGTVC